MSGLRLVWRPPGPVADAFYYNRDLMAGIQGPVGSGKTTTGFHKIIRLGTEQQPSTRDTTKDGRPIRKIKACVVHQTYRQLWRATIKTWWKIIPQSAGHWEGGKDGPAVHTIPFDLADGSQLELILEFVAIGDNQVEDVMRGYEPTLFFLNEADLLPPEIFEYCTGRWARYPSMDEGGPSWHGAFFDFNAPVIGSELHEAITETLEEMFFTYFRQPGGMDPGAENLHNLAKGYYENQIAIAARRGRSQTYIDRMVHNKFGQRRDGKPIFPEFHDARHVAPRDLEPIRGLPLLIGADAGLTPAATLWQRPANGQWRGLDEIATKVNKTMGPSSFSEALNRLLKERFDGWPRDEIQAWVDPSAVFGGEGEDEAWMPIVSRKTGIRFRAAPGNNRLAQRFEAVRRPLKEAIDGHLPGLVISPRMRMTRRGLGGGYRFRKLAVAGERYAEEPEKNAYSHPCESVQYVLLGGGEYAEVSGRRENQGNDWRKHGRVAQDAEEGAGRDSGGDVPRHWRRSGDWQREAGG